MPAPPIVDPSVQAVFDGYPVQIRDKLLSLRALIFQTAQDQPEEITVLETLKWGQPSYLTPICKSGTTIRLGGPKSGGYALFVHCQTSLISEFKALFPDEFTYDGTRAVLFSEHHAPNEKALRLLIRNALTYHRK